MAKKVTRTRAYYQGQLVTILERGRRTSTIRTAHGFVHEGIPNKELDKPQEREDEHEPSEADFTFEVPGVF